MVLLIQNKITIQKLSIMKRTNLLLLVLSFITYSSSAQNDSLSLKECIDITLKNHISIEISRNQVRVAEYQNKEGLASYLPQLNASLSFDDNIKRQTTIIPAGSFSPVPMEVQFGNQFAGTMSGQLDQVIYDQSLINSIRASKMNVGLSELNMELNNENLIYNVASTYFQVLLLQEQQSLIGNNLQKMEELVRVQKLQLDKGQIHETQYKRVEVNYNNIKAQKAQVDLNLALAKETLKNRMGIDSEDEIFLTSAVDLEEDYQNLTITDDLVSNRIDYQILETNILLQEIDVNRKRAQYIPTLSAYARYGANAFGNEFNTTFDQWYDFAAIGLKLNVPIFSGLRRYSQVKQGEFNLELTRQKLELNSRQFTLELKNAQSKLNASYITMQSNEENMELSQSVFEVTQLQYQEGAIGLSDYLNADYAMKEAQSNYLNSKLNFLLARLDLEKSKGSIQEFFNK